MPQVHFFARIREGQLRLSPGQDIILKTAEINEGQCYDVASGKFTVSVSGRYAFAFQYCVQANQNGYIDIVKQGTTLERSTFQTSNTGYQCMLMQTFTTAAISDQIWVRSAPDFSGSYLFDNMYTKLTSFSGVLMLL
ncbi:hypothetical protein DPMN_190348 [Dreissena polymorpha]|uniref:C1q domain-containing protein n=2 Tax=Dreissena polymorpha TaxID=45954 RepID=A0A9D4IBN2_DREPO|nr:hypothetical protein DPMN_190348 [Dreissena polymorpha]